MAKSCKMYTTREAANVFRLTLTLKFSLQDPKNVHCTHTATDIVSVSLLRILLVVSLILFFAFYSLSLLLFSHSFRSIKAELLPLPFSANCSRHSLVLTVPSNWIIHDSLLFLLPFQMRAAPFNSNFTVNARFWGASVGDNTIGPHLKETKYAHSICVSASI